jgi:hypothetical protein
MFRFAPALAYLRSLFAALTAAQAVSAAIVVRRQPSIAALRTLGIDPEAYRSIRLR